MKAANWTRHSPMNRAFGNPGESLKELSCNPSFDRLLH